MYNVCTIHVHWTNLASNGNDSMTWFKSSLLNITSSQWVAALTDAVLGLPNKKPSSPKYPPGPTTVTTSLKSSDKI